MTNIHPLCVCGCGRRIVGRKRKYYETDCYKRARWYNHGNSQSDVLFGAAQAVLQGWRKHYRSATEAEFIRRFNQREAELARQAAV